MKLELQIYITYLKGKDVRIRLVDELTAKNIAFVESAAVEFDILYDTAQTILNTGVNNFYETYFIPKRSGGKRRIDEPAEIVKEYTRDAEKFFTHKLHFNFPTGLAYAYLPETNAIQLAQAVTKQTCILHYDLKDFFPSCTVDVVMKSLRQIYPFCLLDEVKLRTVLEACMLFYDGKMRLSQGAPSSPFWSNLAMLPVDLKLCDAMYRAERDNDRLCPISPQGRYTRYADDIYIGLRGYSPKMDREYITTAMVDRYRKRVEEVINESDFALNTKKTALNYTKHGNVKVLGMYVGDKVQLGAKKKAYLRAVIWRMLMNCKTGVVDPNLASQVGKVEYARQVEPYYIRQIIEKYEQKTGTKYRDILARLQG